MPPTDTTLSARDLSVIRHVARFKQLSATQIRTLLFSDHTNSTPSDRTLRRLTTHSYLHRIERRLVGGARGGSGQYVYGLGRRGFYMHFEGAYYPARNVNHHSLAIADSFITLRSLEKEGKLTLAGISTEPDCWAVVGGLLLKPDLRADVDLPGGRRALYWLEVDMATEAQRQIRGKMEAYWRAYNDADVNEWGVFPLTVWVAVDEEREKELRWLIGQLPAQAQALFAVCTVAGLPAIIR